MITFGIVIVGVVVAVGVLLASFSGKGNATPTTQGVVDPRQVDARADVLQDRVRQNPRDSASLVELGNTYYDAKRWGEAIPWYEKALEIIPADTNVRTDLGTAYLYSGNPDKAKEIWLKVLEQEPNKVQTHFNLGIMYSSLTPPDNDSAAREWETVIRLAPGSENARIAEDNLKRIGRR